MSKEIRAYRIALNVGFLLWWLMLSRMWVVVADSPFAMLTVLGVMGMLVPAAVYFVWWDIRWLSWVERWYWKVVQVVIIWCIAIFIAWGVEFAVGIGK